MTLMSGGLLNRLRISWRLSYVIDNLEHINLSRNYIFGSDPEVFSRDKRGQIVPAFTFLPPKTDPLKVDIQYQHEGGISFPAYIYNDGFQAELRANPHGC